MLCSFLVFTVVGYTQKKGVAAADKKFDNYSYVDAIATYEKVAKGYKDEKCSKTRRLYYFIADLIQAENGTQHFEMNASQEPEYYYRYSQSLKAVGTMLRPIKC
jgi:hypothetical protein